MKIGLVVQRYGEEVIGGAELHARWIAQRLARGHGVEVLTTCAVDYLTWENKYEPGPATVGGVPVLRFPVARRRTMEGFDALSSKVHFFEHTDDEERRWMEEHGPVTPGLLDHLRRRGGEYDALVFFSYRYWTTYHGLGVAPHKSILVPTAEEDGAVRLRIFKDLFRLPAAHAFNSPEERELLLRVTGAADLPGEVVGVGIEDAPVVPPAEIRQRLDILGDYIVYVGRIEREKGCARLFDEFCRYVQERDPHLSLVLVGRAVLPVPVHVNITHLGVLPDAEKLSLIGGSRLLVHPSPFESLSMALLEAWKMGRPALVNGRCAVLRGQVQRANGGLYYGSYEEFREALSWLLSHPAGADALGRAGRAYFERHYSWDVIMEKYERLLALVSGGAERTAR
ncbi:MAG TPA: glycosyltransferase family 4 protein [Vicinamibacteria bacterium]|nr:glycosyltransferase family 4 protein [Vicinamibacteria bacterium]